ncbi:dynamin family protein [Sulfurospirillum multivorans]|uniref:Dynamin-like domain-containing protein n=2 Tax=Sulfurospirillum multivorans TaxID=66821 RepID=A0AA86AJT5_SULMK|nr:dynamin family protein [Sulfurospirillum multivorans]AHJ11829.1 dynamin-like domain-containing protein [Sulfurospirillum multivorans DSM 12446]QEH05335.1 dynamin-like domain-containing protein [Sulfurospirillum multivorans]
MSLIESFVTSYKEHFLKVIPQFDATLLGALKKVQYVLLGEEQLPSIQLKKALDRLQMRSEEPMKVAITGQFSSGKSTFLNALLAKSILPTGITPVTSKVNYIRYGEEFKIRVRYKDGRDEYHDINTIAHFTDQREHVEDIAYLVLYAPLNILKDVVFVDTPGLNSQAASDTQTTEKVLKEVDGIIWLTLIDNAGKMSELQVLEEYLGKYQNKSLCVLNQKDKFTPQQIEETTNYVKTAFKEFFSDVIPISARQALESRSHDKKVMMEETLESFMHALHVKLQNGGEKLDFSGIEHDFKTYQTTLDSILQSDLGANLKLLEESNIDKVLDFIRNEIQPKSTQSKEFAIKKEVKEIVSKLIAQHQLFLCIYDELLEEIVRFETEAKGLFSDLKSKFSHDLKSAFMRIEQIIETIADAIYNQMSSEKLTRYEAQKAGLFSKQATFVPFEYQAPKINSDLIYKSLFYEENLIGKMFKQYVKNLGAIQNEVNDKNRLVYRSLEQGILKWQAPYEVIRKSEELHSDIEFANMRRFASKAYESILKPFNDEIAASYAKISSEFNHLSSAVSFNYQNATEVCVAFLENKIEKSVKLYEENPTKFSLYTPKLDEIKERLRTSFHLYELENMMNTRNTFLSKDYDRLISQFTAIKEEKVAFLEERKARHYKILEQIEALVKEVE